MRSRTFVLLLTGLFCTGCAEDDPTKAPPTVGDPRPAVRGEPNAEGVITALRPMVARLGQGDPMRVALHWEGKDGPLQRTEEGRKVEWGESASTFTFHLTTPGGRRHDLRAKCQAHVTGISWNFTTTPTLLLTLTEKGIESQMVEGTWIDKKPDFSRRGTYKLSISGQITADAEKKGMPFRSGEIEVEMNVPAYLPLKKIEELAREAVRDELRNPQSIYIIRPKQDRERLTIIDDKDHTRLVRFQGPEEEWVYRDYTIPVSPFGKVGKPLIAKISNCIAEGTGIETEHGARPIEQLRIGDRVRAFDVRRGEPVLTAVRDTRSGWASETLLLAGRLRVTEAHPIRASGQWKLAREVTAADTLLDSDGKSIKVGTIERSREPVRVIDLTVDEPHNFFANGLLVHNKDRAWSPDLDDVWYRLWPRRK